MKKDRSIKDWQRMHKSLTDSEERDKARRKEEARMRIEYKRTDVGL